MATPPRRRWFQFSLTTMFVVVTVFAVFIGYHVNWIRQRRDVFTSRQLSPGGHVWVSAVAMPAEPVSAPGMLWIFGEEGARELRVSFDTDIRSKWGNGEPMDITPEEAIEAERIHRLFPEAESFIPAAFYVR